jgi:Family of unknown function (DUF6580)
MQPNKTRSDLILDLALVGGLVALDVVARLVPHVPGVWPVAASALFAGRMLRMPLLAFVVPLAATVLSNVALPGEDGRVLLIVAAALCVPALLGIVGRPWRGVMPTVAAMVGSSLVFFLATNFAVWAFQDLYPRTLQGFAQCYVAALPFLDRTVLGDLAWCAALFGGAWLLQRVPAMARRA